MACGHDELLTLRRLSCLFYEGSPDSIYHLGLSGRLEDMRMRRAGTQSDAVNRGVMITLLTIIIFLNSCNNPRAGYPPRHGAGCLVLG